MGSRKKKTRIETQKTAFISWYKKLSPNERISFKWFAFAEGRRRWTLQLLLKPNSYWGRNVPYKGAGLPLAEAIDKGYLIQWQ